MTVFLLLNDLMSQAVPIQAEIIRALVAMLRRSSGLRNRCRIRGG